MLSLKYVKFISKAHKAAQSTLRDKTFEWLTIRTNFHDVQGHCLAVNNFLLLSNYITKRSFLGNVVAYGKHFTARRRAPARHYYIAHNATWEDSWVFLPCGARRWKWSGREKKQKRKLLNLSSKEESCVVRQHVWLPTVPVRKVSFQPGTFISAVTLKRSTNLHAELRTHCGRSR